MEKETLKKIFEFLEENGEHNAPLLWKHINNIPLTDDELHIKGYLDLQGTNITSLPEGLKVGGTLYLQGTNITSLPEGLKVAGVLDLNRCTSLTSLPEGLEVGSYLDIEGTKITSLPKGLQVESSLHIGGTPLKKYSDDELREMVKPGFIKGKIWR
jgi:hypothetical protein